MTDFIKKLLRESLEELATRQKAVYSRGTEHVLYSSIKNPNVLYKIGDKDTVLKWLKVFKSNPRLFPKIYKAGELKTKYNSGKYYVEIEKLNTDEVINDWRYLEDLLEKIGTADTDTFEGSLNMIFIDLLKGYLSFNGIYKKLSADKKGQELFKKWYNFLGSALEQVRKFGYNGLDIHRYNFAYDSAGNLKAIDI